MPKLLEFILPSISIAAVSAAITYAIKRTPIAAENDFVNASVGIASAVTLAGIAWTLEYLTKRGASPEE